MKIVVVCGENCYNMADLVTVHSAVKHLLFYCIRTVTKNVISGNYPA